MASSVRWPRLLRYSVSVGRRSSYAIWRSAPRAARSTARVALAMVPQAQAGRGGGHGGTAQVSEPAQLNLRHDTRRRGPLSHGRVSWRVGTKMVAPRADAIRDQPRVAAVGA